MSRRIAALLVVLAFLLGTGQAALAADRDELVKKATDSETGAFPPGFFLGPGVFYRSVPIRDVDVVLIPVPTVYYSGKHCSIYVKKGGCGLFERGFFSLDAIADLRLDGYDGDDGDVTDGMDDREISLDAGLGMEFDSPIGDFELAAVHDVLGNHEGAELNLAWSVPLVFEGWVLRFSLEHRWWDSDLADYYYGVEADEALPGRPAYEVGSTNFWAFNFLVNHRISKGWMGIFLAEYERFSDDITDSPIVGEDGQIRALVGAAYRLTKK